MAYIGLEPSNSFVSLKRQVITGNGGASYTLDHSVASVNDVAIFVNNVRQDPAGYSISGTALTLGGTIESSDDCYVIFLGQALQTVTPDSDTITTAMLKSDSVTTAKITDANVTSAKMFSGFANGITEYDMYRISAHTSNTSDADITSNWERVDDPIYEKIGTGISQSSGIFSFPSTGKYLITAVAQMQCRNGRVGHGRLRFYATQDNSSYTLRGQAGMSGDDADDVNCVIIHVLFDVTNTTNDKVKLNIATTTNNVRALGDSSLNRTFISFLKLGDT